MAEILVVDDDDLIRDTLYELLSPEYLCQTAETAEKALARLEAETFDVVLTDMTEWTGTARSRFAKVS